MFFDEKKHENACFTIFFSILATELGKEVDFGKINLNIKAL